MATSKDYLNYISEQLSELEDILYRSMMGEYIVYYRGKIAAYICDDRLLVKPVKSAESILTECIYESPYSGAKDMLLVNETDNKDFLLKLFREMYDDLPYPKSKKKTNKN